MLKSINVIIDVKNINKICKLHEAGLPNIHHRHTLILTKSESSKPKENIRNIDVSILNLFPQKLDMGRK